MKESTRNETIRKKLLHDLEFWNSCKFGHEKIDNRITGRLQGILEFCYTLNIIEDEEFDALKRLYGL